MSSIELNLERFKEYFREKGFCEKKINNFINKIIKCEEQDVLRVYKLLNLKNRTNGMRD
jgi:hypothetical protein